MVFISIDGEDLPVIEPPCSVWMQWIVTDAHLNRTTHADAFHFHGRRS